MPQQIQFNWQMVENEEAWQVLTLRPGLLAPSSIGQRRCTQPAVWSMVGLLLLVSIVGSGHWWRTTEAEAAQIERARQTTLERQSKRLLNGQMAAGWRQQIEQEWQQDHTGPAGASAPPVIHLQALERRGEQALVEVILAPAGAGKGAEAYRETRFYHITPAGWLRTAPVATFWGKPATLETTHFIFHYQARDTATVAAAAARLDALYARMRSDLGLAPARQQVTVIISADKVPTPQHYFDLTQGALALPSPALLRAPGDLAAADILVQSVLLRLGDRLLHEKVWPAFGQARPRQRRGHNWSLLIRVLRLWQLWRSEGPLATGRDGLVHWLYTEAAGEADRPEHHLPAQYDRICALHRVWDITPQALGVPLACTAMDAAWASKHSSTLVWANPGSLLFSTQRPSERGLRDATVALATLIEYAVDSYGQERLPLLVAEFNHHRRWETLAPAVFGVSAEEFQTRWWHYLAQQYAVAWR